MISAALLSPALDTVEAAKTITCSLKSIPVRMVQPGRSSHLMQLGNLKNPVASSFYRCAGPNCGMLKRTNDRWWLMWTSAVNFNQPVLYLCAWDDEIANREGTLHVCGELCAQKLQSQFMGNVRENQLRRLTAGG